MSGAEVPVLVVAGFVAGLAFAWYACDATITPTAQIRECLADSKMPRIIKNKFVCDDAQQVKNEETLEQAKAMNECSMYSVASTREEISCCKLLNQETLKKQVESLRIICDRLFGGKLNDDLECKRGDRLLQSFPFTKSLLADAGAADDGGVP